jgi:hypothetical protein
MKYEFSLILSDAEVTDEDADKLYEAGCDDASILTRDGVTRLQLDRNRQFLMKLSHRQFKVWSASVWPYLALKSSGMKCGKLHEEAGGVLRCGFPFSADTCLLYSALGRSGKPCSTDT